MWLDSENRPPAYFVYNRPATMAEFVSMRDKKDADVLRREKLFRSNTKKLDEQHLIKNELGNMEQDIQATGFCVKPAIKPDLDGEYRVGHRPTIEEKAA
jgi:hypothetical protein